MAEPSKASPSVIAAAIVAILATLFFLLSTSLVFLGFSLDKAPGSSLELPSFARTLLLIMTAFLMCLPVFGIALVYYRPRFLESASEAASAG